MRQNSGFLAALPPVLSALAFQAALPNEFFPEGLPVLGFFCLFPLFYALGAAGNLKRAFLYGCLFGLFFHVSSSYWLANFKEYAIWTLGATTAVYGLFYGFWAVFLGGILRFSGQHFCPFRPFIAAALWAFIEWQKSSGFWGFPWGLLPYSLQSVPLLCQSADTWGVHGLSFLLALSNAALAEFARARRDGKSAAFRAGLPAAAAFAALFALNLGYGIYRFASYEPPARTATVALIQHNADSWTDGENASLLRAIDLSRQALKAAADAGIQVDLIVWSESVLTGEFGKRYLTVPAADPLIPFLEECGVPLLTGAPLAVTDPAGNEGWANGAVLLDGEAAGYPAAAYAKQQLIPFAEVIPFGEAAWMRSLMRRLAGFSSGWVPGKEAAVMEIPLRPAGLEDPSGRARFGTPICFEDAFAGICKGFADAGADFFINLTNDSWSKTVSAETQHLAAARFRCMENRLSMARSANGGITCLIDPLGRVTARIPPFTERFLLVKVPFN